MGIMPPHVLYVGVKSKCVQLNEIYEPKWSYVFMMVILSDPIELLIVMC